MKRCQIVALFDCLDYFFVDNNAGCELLAAMDDSVTYRINLCQRFYNAVISICQSINYHLNRNGVIRHRILDDNLLTACRCMIKSCSVHSDSLA